MVALSGARRSRFLLRWAALAAALALSLLPLLATAQSDPDGQGLQTSRENLLLTGRPFLPPALGVMGWDISWPQCPSSEVPAGQVAFVVIGVSDGRPYTENDCFLQQFTWAVQNSQSTPQIYMNIAGLPDGWTSPACDTDDLPCQAYYYGKGAAEYAVASAEKYDANAPMWWLDVETANHWTTDQFLNERAVKGAIEYLKATGHTVGIYSTPRVWGLLMGSYAPALPVWTAGADDLQVAPDRCSASYAFGGGPVVMVQYVSEHLDANYSCVMPSWPGRRAHILPMIANDGSTS
jgi:hypothetical protein